MLHGSLSFREAAQRFLFYGLCYLSCTLAFYTKGFIGVGIPALAVPSFLVFDRNFKEILKMHLWLGIAIFLAMTLPWFLALWHQGGAEYLKVFLVHNHVDRFAGGSTGHSQPFYYYLTQFPGGFLPWSILIIPVFLGAFGNKSLRRASGAGAFLCQVLVYRGFSPSELASTKRVLYLMPIFAPIALLTASVHRDDHRHGRIKGFEKAFDLAFGIVVFLLGLAVIPLVFYASKKYGFGVPIEGGVLDRPLSLAALVLSSRHSESTGRIPGRFWIFLRGLGLPLLLLGLIVSGPSRRSLTRAWSLSAMRSSRCSGEHGPLRL